MKTKKKECEDNYIFYNIYCIFVNCIFLTCILIGIVIMGVCARDRLSSINHQTKSNHSEFRLKNIEKPKLKKEINMNLTLSNWLLIIAIILLLVKTSHYITLKNFFKPTKKIARHIKKEWEES